MERKKNHDRMFRGSIPKYVKSKNCPPPPAFISKLPNPIWLPLQPY